MHTIKHPNNLFYSLRWANPLLLCLCLCLAGCDRKKQDPFPPTIEVYSPLTGAIFYYQNTIAINAEVRDNVKLESITLEITDAQNNRYLDSKTYLPQGNSFILEYTISHTDLYLTSGSYFVRITASDGENTLITFREIQLMEAPRVLERVFVVRENGSASSIDTLGESNVLPCQSYNHPYLFGAIDSRSQQLVACSNSPSTLLSRSFPDFLELSTAFPPTNEVLTAFYHDKNGHRFFWGSQTGTIWKTDLYGTQAFASLGQGAKVIAMGSSPSHLIVITENANNNERYVHALRADNGIAETSLAVGWEAMGVVAMDSDNQRVLLIGNEGNVARFQWFNLATSALNEVFNFYESSTILSVCDASGNDFYTIQANGIVRYSNLLGSFNTTNSVPAEKLFFDDLSNTLWAIAPNTLYQLDATGTSVLRTASTPGIIDVWLKYNK
jgi:hypothetical protein